MGVVGHSYQEKWLLKTQWSNSWSCDPCILKISVYKPIDSDREITISGGTKVSGKINQGSLKISEKHGDHTTALGNLYLFLFLGAPKGRGCPTFQSMTKKKETCKSVPVPRLPRGWKRRKWLSRLISGPRSQQRTHPKRTHGTVSERISLPREIGAANICVFYRSCL